MARPQKNRFDSFSLTSDVFFDLRIRELSQCLGPDAALVLLSIYLRATTDSGYFLPLTPVSLELVCGDGNSSRTVEFVKNVIEEAVRLRIFDETKYREYRVLTSEYLQTTFCTRAKAAKRRNIILDERYALIEIDEKGNAVKSSKQIDINNLSRMIVQRWNMANSSHPERQVPEEIKDDDFILDALSQLIETYPDYANIDPWFAIIRNAVVAHPDFRLVSILCNEQMFKTLFEMGEPQDFVPGEFSPPKGYLHPAMIQEGRMKRAGYSDEEILNVTTKLLNQQPVIPMPPAPVETIEDESDVSAMFYPNPQANPMSDEALSEVFSESAECVEDVPSIDAFQPVEEPVEQPVEQPVDQQSDEPSDELSDEPSDELSIDKQSSASSLDDLNSNVIITYQDFSAPQPVSVPVFVTNASTESADQESIEQGPAESEPEFDSPTRTPVLPEAPQSVPAQPKAKAFFAGFDAPIIMDGEELLSPEEKTRREILQKEQKEIQKTLDRNAQSKDSPYVTEFDPELSPFLKDILTHFNEEIKKRSHLDPEKECIDAEMFSQEKHALAYLRAYIEAEPRFKDLSFWELVIEGLLDSHSRRGAGFPLDRPAFFFDTDIIVGYGRDSDFEDRTRLLKMFVSYVTAPDRLSDPEMREGGKLFVMMKEQEKKIREKEASELIQTESQEESEEEITFEQREQIEAIRNDPTISKGDLGWMEERILHPERFKDPNKPYGDRTAPLPWAKKNPPKYEEVISDPNFCHRLAHGSSIRSLKQTD